MRRPTDDELTRSVAHGVCWCGERPRGNVDTSTAGVPAHFCRQCSEGHCELEHYLRGRGLVTS